MWRRLTERSRRAIFFAQQEASKLDENVVCTEHLLIGIVQENDTNAVWLLNRMGISPEEVQSEVKRQFVRREGQRTTEEIQLTSKSKRVLDLAYEEARQINGNAALQLLDYLGMRVRYIGTEHLLIGLIRNDEGLAGRILCSLGVNVEHTRHALLSLRMEEPQRNENSCKPL